MLNDLLRANGSDKGIIVLSTGPGKLYIRPNGNAKVYTFDADNQSLGEYDLLPNVESPAITNLTVNSTVRIEIQATVKGQPLVYGSSLIACTEFPNHYAFTGCGFSRQVESLVDEDFRWSTNLISVPASIPEYFRTLEWQFAYCKSFNQNLSTWNTAKIENIAYSFAYTDIFNDPSLNTWNVSNVENMQGAFKNAVVFNKGLNSWNTEKVTDMSHMFNNAFLFNSAIGWNTKSVTTMASMFKGATSFNQAIGNWDVSALIDASNLFYDAVKFNQPLHSWNVSNVENMQNMFYGATVFNRTLDSWNTTKVKNMRGMFTKAVTFNAPISTWNVSSVENMASMFNGATKFNKELNAWDTSKVTDMSYMFNGAIAFNGAIDQWDTSKVTDMSYMFNGATVFNSTIDQWDTSKVTTMVSMFNNAVSFNQPLTSWKTKKVTDMNNMFSDAVSFNQPLLGWDTRNVTNMSRMFFNATSFSQPLNNWKVGKCSSFSDMFKGVTNYDGIQDLSLWCTPLITEIPSGWTFETSKMPVWGTCPINTAVDTDYPSLFLMSYPTEQTIRLDIESADAVSQGVNVTGYEVFVDNELFTTVTNRSFTVPALQHPAVWSFKPIFSDGNIYNADYTFTRLQNLREIVTFGELTTGFRIQGVTESAFEVPSSIPLNLTNASGMFLNCTKFNSANIEFWNTEKLVEMGNMFNGTVSLNRSLKNWCVTNILAAPVGFNANSGLTAQNSPTWGTCPVEYVASNLYTSFILEAGGEVSTAIDITLKDNDGVGIPFNLYVDDGAVPATVTNGVHTLTVPPSAPRAVYTIRDIDWALVGNGANLVIDGKNTTLLESVLYFEPSHNGKGLTSVSFPNNTAAFNVPLELPSTVVSLNNAFDNCPNFNASEVAYWDVTNVLHMENMLRNTVSFNTNLSAWCVSNILSEPANFALNSGISAASKPVWATCPVRVTKLISFETDRAAKILVDIKTGNSFTKGLFANIYRNDILYARTNSSGICDTVLPSGSYKVILDTPHINNSAVNTDDVIVKLSPTTGVKDSLVAITEFFNGLSGINVNNFTSEFTVPGTLPDSFYYLNNGFVGCTKFNDLAIAGWRFKDGKASLERAFKGCSLFNQDLTNWCVTTVLAEPTEFSIASPLSAVNKPKWGTCPVSYTIATIDLNDSVQAGEIVLNFVDRINGNTKLEVFNKTTNKLIFNDLPTGSLAFAKTAVDSVLEFRTNVIPTADVRNVIDDGNVNNGTLEFSLLYGATATKGLIKGYSSLGVCPATLTFLNDIGDVYLPQTLPSTLKSLDYFFAYKDNTSSLKNWDTSNIVSMAHLAESINSNDFYSIDEHSNFNNYDIIYWNTANVKTLRSAFANNAKINVDLSAWSTVNVISMQNTFQNAISFNAPLVRWNVANVTNMDNMFSGATVFNQDLSKWCVSNISTLPTGFANTILSSSITLLPVWGTCPFNPATAYPESLTLVVNSSVSSLGFSVNTNSSGGLLSQNILIDGVAAYNSTDGLLTLPADKLNKDVFITVTVDESYNSLVTDTRVIGTGSATIKKVFNFPRLGNRFAISGIGSVFTVPTAIPHMLTSLEGLFTSCTQFNDPSILFWDVRNVTNMSQMFNNASNFNQNINKWNTSNVTTMQGVFASATSFNQPLNNWDTSNVTNIEYMFQNAVSFNQPLNKWNTSKVTNMKGVFASATSFNQPLNSWNTGNVTNMQDVFYCATNFNQNINNWDTSKVTNMQGMFAGIVDGIWTTFNQPLDNWNTGNVTNMNSVFRNNSSFNQNINSWNTSKVTNMSDMFWNATSFNQPLNNWDTSNITIMYGMFSGATSFNQPLDNWDVSNVTTMQGMFTSATSFNQPLNSWEVSNVTNMNGMFNGATNFKQYLGGWCVSKILSAPVNFSVTSALTSNELPVWGTCPNELLSGLADNEMLIRTIAGTLSIRGRNGDTFRTSTGTVTTFTNNNEVQVSVPAGIHKYTVSTANTANQDIEVKGTPLVAILNYPRDVSGPRRFGTGGSPNLLQLPKYLPPYITSLEHLCYNATNFNQPLNNWDTRNVTNMRDMFNGASSFNKPLDKWDTSNVTNMFAMFNNATSFNQNINSWNTSNVTNMSFMFANATNFNQNINNWDTSNVTNMHSMLYGATNFNQPLNKWNTSNVTNMSRIFFLATNFNQPLDNWDTSNVTNMWDMFYAATNFNHPLDNWDVSNVTDMQAMFNSARNFNQPLDNWDVSNVTNILGMFTNTTNFKQYLGRWCVSKISSTPTNFSTGSKLESHELPKWGTCPVKPRLLDNEFELYCRAGTIYITGRPGDRFTLSNGTIHNIVDSTSVLTINTGANGVCKYTINNSNSADLPVIVGGPALHSILNFPKSANIRNIRRLGVGWVALRDSTNLVSVPTYLPSYLTDISGMFHGASSFNQYIGYWDTSSVTNMRSVFDRATSFNQPLDNWNTSNVTNMGLMFFSATSFNQPLNNWDTSNVTTMYALLNTATSFNQPLNNWDTSNVTSMESMFNGASSFNKPLDKWDVSNVTNMASMFYSATNFNQPLNKWDVSNVTDMSYMFRNATIFDQDINNWNTSNVVNMSYMFSATTNFNQPLNNWDTSKVTNMFDMFAGSTNFNQNINDWDVSNVTQMYGMFYNATNFNQPLDNWNTSNVADMSYMFNGANSFSQDLSSWCVSLIDSSTKYHNFITSGTALLPQFYPKWGTCPVKPVAQDNEMVFIVSAGDFKVIGRVGDTIVNLSNQLIYTINNTTENIISLPEGKYKYVVSLSNNDNGSNTIILGGNTLLSVNNFPKVAPNNLNRIIFKNASNLVAVPIELPSYITDLSMMFNGATNFNQNINSWNTSNVTNMNSMFNGATNFNQPLDKWDTSNVANMGAMFGNTANFNQSLNNWNTSNLIIANDMFSGATRFNQPLNNWDTSNVTNMIGMFYGASKFNQYIGYWDTSNVTNMSMMFANANSFNQYLGNWCVSKITELPYAFTTDLTAMENINYPVWGTCPLDKLKTIANNEMLVSTTAGTFKMQGRNGDTFTTSTGSITNFTDTTVKDITVPAGVHKIKVANSTVDRYLGLGGEALKTVLNFPKATALSHITFTHGAINLVSVPSILPSYLTNMWNMFNGCSKFNQPLDTWDTSNIISMEGLFYNASKFDQNINNWNISNVVNLNSAFGSASSFNQPLDKWDTSNVTNMRATFQNASSFNQPLNTWNTSKVTTMEALFSNALEFNQPLSSWDTSKVTTMFAIFSTARKFNQNINSWNTSNVTNMRSAFAATDVFNKPLNNWNVSKVTNMQDMFYGAKVFNQPLNKWNTGNVNSMVFLFNNATSFNQDLTNWNVALIPSVPLGFSGNSPLVNEYMPKWGTTGIPA